MSGKAQRSAKDEPQFLVQRLLHPDSYVGEAALQVLEELSAEERALHMASIVQRLEDTNWYVREAALHVLRKQSAEELSPHVGAIVQRLEDAVWQVRQAALQVLGQLSAEELSPHVGAIVQRLDDDHPYWHVRRAALQVLGQLSPDERAPHMGAIVQRLEDTDGEMRRAALQGLGRLSVEERAPLMGAIVQRLECPEWRVRQATLHVLLGELSAEDLSPHVGAIVQCLEDPEWPVREATLQVLGQLSMEDRAPHLPAFKRWLGDPASRKCVKLGTLGCQCIPRWCAYPMVSVLRIHAEDELRRQVQRPGGGESRSNAAAAAELSLALDEARRFGCLVPHLDQRAAALLVLVEQAAAGEAAVATVRGIGPKLGETLRKEGVLTVADLAGLSAAQRARLAAERGVPLKTLCAAVQAAREMVGEA